MPDIRSVQSNPVCGTEAFHCITVAEIRESLAKRGIFPFQPCIAETSKTCEENTRIETPCAAEIFKGLWTACLLQSVRKRHTERETFEAVSDIIGQASRKHSLLSSRTLQQVAVVMKKRVTVHSVLQDICINKPTAFDNSNCNMRNFPLYNGAPAECLTVGEAVPKTIGRKLAQAVAKAAKQIGRGAMRKASVHAKRLPALRNEYNPKCKQESRKRKE